MLASMDEPEHFEILEDHAVFRPTGQLSVELVVQLIATAIAFARERGIRKLLVDTSNLTGFEPPNIVKRYFFVHELARSSAGVVHVAFVVRSEFLDRQKLGRTIATKFGFTTDVFKTEGEALVWLRRLN